MGWVVWGVLGVNSLRTFLERTRLARSHTLRMFFQVRATRPVPDDGTTTAMIDLDLMWRPAHKANGHRVHWGVSSDALVLACELEGEVNLCTPPQVLTLGVRYYWRVDAVLASGALVVGDVWSLMARDHFVVERSMPSHDSFWDSNNPSDDWSAEGKLRVKAKPSGGVHLFSAVQFTMGLGTPRHAVYTSRGCSLTVRDVIGKGFEPGAAPDAK